MSKFVEVKTADLVGAALDWAVGQVEKPGGLVVRDATDNIGRRIIGIADDANDPCSWLKSYYAPSTDWSQGGPLIDKIILELKFYQHELPETSWRGNAANGWGEGPTPLIASCRAIVASVLGETVSVPKELCHE